MSLVMDRVQEHYDFVLSHFDKNNVIGIFLVGSQNYGTDLSTSDVDTKTLITPTLTDIYLDHSAVSTTYQMPNSNEYVGIKDIRKFLYEITKQNINVLEILYTDYCILNPIYKDIWEKLLLERDKIVRYDSILAAKAIKGNAFNAFDRIYDKNQEINKKQVANLVRYEYFLTHYLNGASFKECLRPNEDTVKYILQIRTGELGQASLRTIAETTADSIKERVDSYIEKEIDLLNFNKTEIQDFLNEICRDFIDSSFLIEYAKREII